MLNFLRSRGADTLRSPRPCLLAVVVLLSLCPLFGQDGSVKWTFDTSNAVESSPAVGDEGIVFVGSNGGILYAVQPDGTEKWQYDTGALIDKAPAVADDGTVYVGNNDGKLFASNPDGTLKWTFDPGTGGAIGGPVAIAADGTVYVSLGVAVDAGVYAVNPDGSQYWSYKPQTTTKGIVVGQNGLVVFADANGGVYALDAQGNEQWRVDYTNGINYAPIIAEDGTIYYGSNSEFGALDPSDGSLLWEVSLNVGESPSIGSNGDIYVPLGISASEGAVVALDPSDGSEKWRYTTTARVHTTPAVGLDGTIYFGSDAEELVALSPNGSVVWTYTADGDVQSSPTIVENGTLYFGSNDRHLYALRTSSAGLSASAWPKKQRDVRNTGRQGSDVTRRRWFAPHVYWVDDENLTIVTISHIGGSAGHPLGTTASFRIDVRDRDGSVLFSIEDSVEPGQTKDIVLQAPDSSVYAGSAVIDAPVKDGLSLAPYLTWVLNVSSKLEPLHIGAFFSDPTDAAQEHHFPAEASQSNGLGIAVQNIGDNSISCSLEFVSADGTSEGTQTLDLSPLGSVVQFFNDSVPEGFKGRGAFLCDAPVVAVAVNQDFSNGGFPTDRVTIKGVH